MMDKRINKDGHVMERNAMTEIIYVRRDKR